MTATQLVALITATWTLLAILGGPLLGGIVRRADQQQPTATHVGHGQR